MPRPGDLVAFDVDGTLVEHPEGKVVWQLLNRRFVGTDDVNRERLARFLGGELAYADWVALDVDGWRRAGATLAQVREALGELRPVPGALETLRELRSRGYRLALLSGTLDVTVRHCLPELEVEEAFLNRLRFAADGSLDGCDATPYDMAGKALGLRELARRMDLPLERCAFVGDHLNDVEAARAAGFSIAWNPRVPELEEAASVTVRAGDLRAILRWFPGDEATGSPGGGVSGDRAGTR